MTVLYFSFIYLSLQLRVTGRSQGVFFGGVVMVEPMEGQTEGNGWGVLCDTAVRAHGSAPQIEINSPDDIGRMGKKFSCEQYT